MKPLWRLGRTILYLSLGATVAGWWIPLTWFARRARWPAAWSWPQWLGALGFLGAVAIFLTSAWFLVFRGKGTPAPFDPPKHLVQRGPFRWVRNPMALSFGTAIAAEAVFLQSWHIGVYWVCLVCALQLFVVLHEEPALRFRFGAIYEDYRRAVPRWLPRKPRPALHSGTPFKTTGR